MDVNLSKIQSVPRLNGDWEYMFYADLELNPDHDFELVRDILGELCTRA